MEEIVVRPMVMDDLEAVTELEAECFSVPWSRAALKDSLEQPHYIFLVAEIDGKITGYIGMQCVADEGNVTDVCTAYAYRRRGVAYSLIGVLLVEAKKRGIGTVFLEVRKTNEAAIRLYKDARFEEIGIRKSFYENPREDAILMRKEV